MEIYKAYVIHEGLNDTTKKLEFMVIDTDKLRNNAKLNDLYNSVLYKSKNKFNDRVFRLTNDDLNRFVKGSYVSDLRSFEIRVKPDHSLKFRYLCEE